MRVLGIGVDMVEVGRFRDMTADPRPTRQFLTEGESQRMKLEALTPRSLAGIFAAKEAIIKASGSAWPQRAIFFNDIEVDHRPNGAPHARFLDAVPANVQILLSVSHTQEHAIAFAMVVQGDNGNERRPGQDTADDLL